MKPRDALFMIEEIQKQSKKLWSMELATLKSVKHRLAIDLETTKNQDKMLMAIYGRVTEVKGRIH